MKTISLILTLLLLTFPYYAGNINDDSEGIQIPNEDTNLSEESKKPSKEKNDDQSFSNVSLSDLNLDMNKMKELEDKLNSPLDLDKDSDLDEALSKKYNLRPYQGNRRKKQRIKRI